jgi:hypothetical protein
MNVSEPSDDASLERKRCQNRGRLDTPGQVWRQPAYCPDGSRCIGGMSYKQALVWNMGTCSAMQREKTSSRLAVRMNTDVLGRGGVARSSFEGSVMGLERRGNVIEVDVLDNSLLRMT